VGDGLDLASAYDAAHEAAQWVRRQRRPAVLHLRTVRLMGHAGADAEVAYRPAAEIAADLDLDPLLGTARELVRAGVLTTAEALARYDEIGWQVRKVAEEVLGEAKLRTAAEVVAPLAPRRPVRVARAVADTGAALAMTPPGVATTQPVSTPATTSAPGSGSGALVVPRPAPPPSRAARPNRPGR
jgi:2-oxoisovalerate dehydrogenase E1 component